MWQKFKKKTVPWCCLYYLSSSIILYLLPRCFPSSPPCVQVHLNPKPHWNWTIGPPPHLWENKALAAVKIWICSPLNPWSLWGSIRLNLCAKKQQNFHHETLLKHLRGTNLLDTVSKSPAASSQTPKSWFPICRRFSYSYCGYCLFLWWVWALYQKLTFWSWAKQENYPPWGFTENLASSCLDGHSKWRVQGICRKNTSWVWWAEGFLQGFRFPSGRILPYLAKEASQSQKPAAASMLQVCSSLPKPSHVGSPCPPAIPAGILKMLKLLFL